MKLSNNSKISIDPNSIVPEKRVEGKRVAFTTLGCKLNFSETSTIARTFIEQGYTRVDFKEKADIYVINSCSVTDSADKKSRTIIKQANKLNPSAFIVVTGCYAQLKPDEVSTVPGVDLVVGSEDKANIIGYLQDRFDHTTESNEIQTCSYKEIDKFNHAYSFGDRTRTFLKVQDGCNYFCTYCTIPMARGKSRNPSIESLIDEAKTISSQGVKEIILTGVNIGDFGRSTGETFLDLLKELDRVDGIERIRIGSVEPNLLTNEIIRFTAESRTITPHFHIPLQAGSDEVLKLMKRKYNTDLFKQRVELIKEIIPHAFIGVDIIAGMNGESRELFQKAYDFVKELPISQLHVFPYSERASTQALKIEGRVDIQERRARAKELHQLSSEKQRLFYLDNIGREDRIIFEESSSKETMSGWTDNYIKVTRPYSKDLINVVSKVVIDDTVIDNLD